MSVEFRNYCIDIIYEINESINRLEIRRKYFQRMEDAPVIEIIDYLIKIKIQKVKELKNRIEENLAKDMLKNKGNQLNKLIQNSYDKQYIITSSKASLKKRAEELNQ